MKIWYRYLFSRLIQSFLFLLLSIVIIYTIIDFSIRGVKILSYETGFSTIVFHYLHQFTIYCDLFISLAFLLSSLKVLLDCNKNQELTALQMSGLSKKKLLLPFFSLAVLLFLTSYTNSQWLAPETGDDALSFQETVDADNKSKKGRVFSLTLKDNSELIYQTFLEETEQLFDVYWVRSSNDIWHMKFLDINTVPPVAQFTDHLVRSKEGSLEKLESFLDYPLPELELEKGSALQRFIPFENRSLTTLWKQAQSSSSEKHAVFSHLHYKLSLAFFPLLILLALAPRSFFFSRTQSSFLFVTCALFTLLSFMTLLNGMLILAENQVLPATLAIWGPIGLGFLFILRPFSKLL